MLARRSSVYYYRSTLLPHGASAVLESSDAHPALGSWGLMAYILGSSAQPLNPLQAVCRPADSCETAERLSWLSVLLPHYYYVAQPSSVRRPASAVFESPVARPEQSSWDSMASILGSSALPLKPTHGCRPACRQLQSRDELLLLLPYHDYSSTSAELSSCLSSV